MYKSQYEKRYILLNELWGITIMPELPEVETIRRTLKQLVLNETIVDVTVHWVNIIKQPESIDEFRQLLQGQTIHQIERKGKFLLFMLDDYTLVSHLRMEGKYRVDLKEEPLDKHTHVIFHFESGKELRYNDVRKFGTMHVFKKGIELNEKPLNMLGPDPFESHYTFDYIYERFKRTRRYIKATLLDQSIIAGLGNIYVDEVLFKSKIHPETRTNRLTKKQIKRIKEASYSVLKEAVELGGTTIRSYVDGEGEMGMFQQQLFVYGQDGKPCQQCETEIVKLKVAGRGTHICPNCQKKK